MIHYNLVCAQSHEFDGWFASSAAFDAQAVRGLVECPICGNTGVTRALMAPAVPAKSNRRADPVPAPVQAEGQKVSVSGDHLPDQVRAALQKLRAEVEKNADYVGQDIADEARRIHNGESERRAIYGEATPEQAEALADDGIPVAQIPWVSRADS